MLPRAVAFGGGGHIMTNKSGSRDDNDFASFIRRAEQIRAADDTWQERQRRVEVERAEEQVRQRRERLADLENVVSAAELEAEAKVAREAASRLIASAFTPSRVPR